MNRQIGNTLKICLFLILLSSSSPLLAAINHKNIALLVNLNDADSIEIAEYYQQQRHIPDQHVIYLDFEPGKEHLSEAEFDKISRQLAVKVNDNIQAYVLAWRKHGG